MGPDGVDCCGPVPAIGMFGFRTDTLSIASRRPAGEGFAYDLRGVSTLMGKMPPNYSAAGPYRFVPTHCVHESDQSGFPSAANPTESPRTVCDGMS